MHDRARHAMKRGLLAGLFTGLLAIVPCQTASAVPTIAVADLKNDSGQDQLDPAGPGAASMLVTKFSRVDGLQVVERAQLEAVLSELDLSASGLVDPQAAVKAGRLLGADYLAFGNVISFDGDALTVALRVTDTETAAVVVAEDVRGNLGEDGAGFFQLVNTLAERIISALEIELTPEEERAMKSVRQRELEGLLRYGTGETALGEVVDTGIRCRLAPGDYVPASSPSVQRPLIGRFRDGEVSEDDFYACAAGIDSLQSDADRTVFWSRLLKAALSAVRQEDPRATTLISALALRPPDSVLEERPTQRAEKVTERLARKKDNAYAQALSDVLALEQGISKGTKVTSATLQSASESELVRMARRLPDAGLREAAATDVLTRRIAASPLPLVQNNADVVRDTVLQRGYWPLPADAAVASVTADLPAVQLKVKARPMRSDAQLRLVSDGDDANLELASIAVTLAGHPEVELTVCREIARYGELFDPTPCIPVDRITSNDPFFVVGSESLQVPGTATVDDLVALGDRGDVLVPGISVSGVALSGVEIPVVFAPVPSISFGGGWNGSQGPDLEVELYSIRNGRVLVGVQAPGRDRVAAVVPGDDPGFRVHSVGGRGVDGQPGQPGQDGAAGFPGNPGTCENNGGDGTDGENGTDGGAGGPGGPGGDGGSIRVTVHCEAALGSASVDCALLERFAKERIASLGGDGGAGGPGGRGGDGGEGGPGGDGAKCEVYDDFLERNKTVTTWDGSNGQRGQNGRPGDRGPEGPDGRPGQVVVRVTR